MDENHGRTPSSGGGAVGNKQPVAKPAVKISGPALWFDKSLEAQAPTPVGKTEQKAHWLFFALFLYSSAVNTKQIAGDGDMKFVIVTNNPRVRDELGQEFEVDFADITYREVLCKVRDLVYAGHKLLTHPLSGSVKPNETPYKSIMVAKNATKMDVQDAAIMENSIVTADKFSVKFPEMPDSVREDFQLIDTTLIKSALMSIPEIF